MGYLPKGVQSFEATKLTGELSFEKSQVMFGLILLCKTVEGSRLLTHLVYQLPLAVYKSF